MHTSSIALLAAIALTGCGPTEESGPALDAEALASDTAGLDAQGGAADGVADGAADGAASMGAAQRFPWGAHFDQAAAAAHCADAVQPQPWWCGWREAADAGGDAGLDDTWLAFRLTDDPCPPALGWEIEEPYAGLGHPDLDRVCRYVSSLAGPAPFEALPDSPDIRVERDRQVVAAHALPDTVWQPLEQAWRTQMNLPDWSNAANVAPVNTRVAIIDSSRTGDADGGPRDGSESAHGLAIGNIARAIGCPAGRGDPGPCAAELVHHLALPRIYGGEISERGGVFGSQGEFAAAVVAVVADWRTAGGARLILNLSLGWTDTHGGDPLDERRFTPLLGLWALDAAACDGALAIAAAGNRAHPDAVGPTYPAAWAALPSLCDPSVPPVYAVGGVDGRDLPLAVARPGGHPRLVAPAAQVMLHSEGRDVPAGDVPLSGTSLAAAAASGSAALVWGWRPDLDAAEVMQVIYDAGAPVDGLTEFGLDGPVPRHRLDVCAALTAACADGDCVEATPPCLGRPADARADHAALLQVMHPGAVAIDGEPTPPVDAVDVADSPYATPQPNVPQCPYCGISGGKLIGELTHIPDAVLTAVKLHIDDGLGGVQIALPELPIGAPFKVDIGYDGEVKGAWLSGAVMADGKLVQAASEIVVGD